MIDRPARRLVTSSAFDRILSWVDSELGGESQGACDVARSQAVGPGLDQQAKNREAGVLGQGRETLDDGG